MITPEEFVERLCLVAAHRGPRGFPRRRRDRQILMKSIVMLFDSEKSYREPEVNELLRAWSREVAPAIATDHVTLRRLLVDAGHLERTQDGSRYRVGFPPRPLAFDLEVDDIDVRATVAVYLADAASRRAASAAAHARSAGPAAGASEVAVAPSTPPRSRG
jgi:hypothetical protein